jgi:hypothetical protein
MQVMMTLAVLTHKIYVKKKKKKKNQSLQAKRRVLTLTRQDVCDHHDIITQVAFIQERCALLKHIQRNIT